MHDVLPVEAHPLSIVVLLTLTLHDTQRTMNDMRAANKSSVDEEKEKKRAEKMAQMMAGFETVRLLCTPTYETVYDLTKRSTRVSSRRRRPISEPLSLD